MTAKRTYGHTKAGKPIDAQMVEDLAAEAERGYDSGQLKSEPRSRD